MNRVWRRATSVAVFLITSFFGVSTGTGTADAHPLHTSLTEIELDQAASTLRLSIRVFVDDYFKASRAMLRSNPPPVGSTASELLAYARTSFTLADGRGAPMPMASCGAKRVGDLMWMCFTVPAPGGSARFHVADKILFDLYADQINIVQAKLGTKKVNLLFTKGDGFKRLE